MQRQLQPGRYHEDEDEDDDNNVDDDGIHHVVEDGRRQGQCVAQGVCQEEGKAGLLIVMMINNE